MTTRTLAETIGAVAHPLTGTAGDYDLLLHLIGEARFVLIGEASHGTHEFYHARAAITKRLIEEKNFTAVAVEADWPDAYRVNCYVRGAGDDTSAERSLAGFKCFPTWMWRNADVLEFAEWLRARNEALPPGASRTGFYGLDLYSLYGSMDAVLGYLRQVDPAAFERARARYACFDHFHGDTQAYGYAATLGLSASCEEAVLNQLFELQRHAAEYSRHDGGAAADRYFYAEQNARLVKNAEEYYRSMFGARAASWNLRDTHMADTLDALVAHLGRHGAPPKIVLWAHNSHLGDARDGDERPRRIERRPVNARAPHGKHLFSRFQHLQRNGDGGFGLGQTRRAQARATRSRRQL